jgi:hypothetical protein
MYLKSISSKIWEVMLREFIPRLGCKTVTVSRQSLQCGVYLVYGYKFRPAVMHTTV